MWEVGHTRQVRRRKQYASTPSLFLPNTKAAGCQATVIDWPGQSTYHCIAVDAGVESRLVQNEID